MQKLWKVADKAPADFISQLGKFHPLISQLLYTRGIQKQAEADLFFSPDYSKLHDPFLFKDMSKAVERIIIAIKNNEKILIHGDYDADGVTSSAVLYRTLKFFKADVEVFLPHREKDGYGLRLENVKKFIESGVKLLITVDCGVTNVEEIKYLMDNGVDVILTDHHEPLEVLPEPFAMLDAKVEACGYPFRSLSGAGVAFKLVQGLFDEKDFCAPYFQSNQEYFSAESFEKWLMDIVAVGTVADVVPLIDENRILVKWGLIVLGKTRNLGLKKLLEVVGSRKIDSFTIGYQLAPRLNAAGRMNHAGAAFRLLVAEDEAEAEALAEELQQNNMERQKATEIAVGQAKTLLLSEPETKFLLAYNPDWEPGVVGLIAGKLCDEYYRPVIAMTQSLGRVIGSGRSVEGFNITQCLVGVKDYLARYGGHAQACGFTLVDLNLVEQFKNEILNRSLADLEKLEFSPTLMIDSELDLSEINFEIINYITSFEPYGEGNDKPCFQINDLMVVALDSLGANSQHLRLNVKGSSPKIYKMMWFGQAKEWIDKLNVGATIDAVVELGINEWNGRREIEFKVVDLRIKS